MLAAGVAVEEKSDNGLTRRKPERHITTVVKRELYGFRSLLVRGRRKLTAFE
jgi:hypothetical protein